MTDLEPESAASVRARRDRWRSRAVQESLFGFAFLLSVLAAIYFTKAEPSMSLGAIAAVIAAVGVLAFWFFAYVSWYRTLDEFERNLQLQSLALAGGLTVWVAAVWGLAEEVFDAPNLPIFLLAPIYSIFYVGSRYIIALRFK